MSELTELMRQVNRLQATVDNLVNPEVGRWVDWTPTVDQNGAVAATITYAKYITIANTVHIRAVIAITGTGTAGNNIIVQGFPTAITPTDTGGFSVIGSCQILDSGVTFYVGIVKATATTDFTFHNNGSASPIGTTPSFALASGDNIAFMATYER